MDESIMDDADLMGMSEEEIDKQCAEIFGDSPPIIFNARSGEQVDTLMSQYINEMNITIPILWVKDNYYLIGSQRLICEIKRNCLLVRVGGGYESFQEYVIKNDRYFQRMLIIYMIKSGETLDYIIECLLENKSIKGVHQEAQVNLNTKRRNSVSPMGRSNYSNNGFSA